MTTGHQKRLASLIVIVLILQTLICKQAHRACETDSHCREFYGAVYYCEPIDHLCRRKSILADFGIAEVLCLFAMMIVNALSGSVGGSSGGIFMAVLIIGMQFTLKDSNPVIKICVFCSSLMNFLFTLFRLDGGGIHRICLDWALCSYAMLFRLAGCMVGMIFNQYLSEFVIFLVMIVVTFIAFVFSAKKTIAIYTSQNSAVLAHDYKHRETP